MEALLEPVVPISSLSQYLYCKRRCALIHVEGLFVENAYTLEGRFLHSRVDQQGVHHRRGTRLAFSVPLASKALGLLGIADMVEFSSGKSFPVEYKRGKLKRCDNVDVQLCGQAICLEEQLGVEVSEGAVYYAGSRRRRRVLFDRALREKTRMTTEAVQAQLRDGHVPAAALTPRCRGCSLQEVCLPEATARRNAAGLYIAALLSNEVDNEVHDG